jgi:hypothetical protein
MRDLKIADRMARRISTLIAPEYVCISYERVTIQGPTYPTNKHEVSLGEFVQMSKVPVEDLVKYLDDGNRLKRCILEVRLGEA